MKLLIEKASCKINETLSGSVWEIDTDSSIVLVDEGKEYLLLPSSNTAYEPNVPSILHIN